MTDDLTAAALASITSVLQRSTVCVAWSGGKDSSALLNLVMQAARALRARGVALRPIIVTNGDTGVENPEIRTYVDTEIARVRAFARAHDIPLEIAVSKPTLSESWQCRVIGGRALPSFPGTNHDCTTELKISPMTRLRKQVLGKTGPSDPGTVTLIGTRFEESPSRAARMSERGETADAPWVGDDGGWYLSPIALWGADDVWTHLSHCRNGRPGYKTFSDFEDVFRIYADAAGTSCAVVGDLSSRDNAKPCGARTGCWCCTPVGRDKSLEAMIEGDPKYAYLLGLNRLQRFLVNTRWDLSRRNWLGRSIDEDGYVAVAPDAYSPEMLKALLRYCLTLDEQERERAAKSGIAPRFEIIDVRTLIAIDAMWNLQGFHRPFEAWAVYRDIHQRGARYPVPEVAPVPRPQTLPAKRFLFVAEGWRDHRFLGLRDPVQELSSAESACMGTRVLRNGTQVMDMEQGVCFDIDAEGAWMFVDYELDRCLRGRARFGITDGYLTYTRLGLLSLPPSSVGVIDGILKRTAWKHEHGLAGQTDPQDLINRSVARKDRSPPSPSVPDLPPASPRGVQLPFALRQQEGLALDAQDDVSCRPGR